MKTRSQIQGRNKSQIHRQQRLQQSHTCRLESISASIPLQPHPNKPTAVQSDGAPVSILQPRPSNSKPFLAGQDPAKAAKEKGGTVQGKDVPVEVQTQKALDPEDREKIVANMYAEFKARRKLLLTGLPHDCCWEVQLFSVLPSLVPRPSTQVEGLGMRPRVAENVRRYHTIIMPTFCPIF